MTNPRVTYTLHIALERDTLDSLILYLLYIRSSEMCDTDFSFLTLVTLLKLMGVNMDKSYWTA